MIDVSFKYELTQKWIHFPFFLSFFFPSVVTASFCYYLQFYDT